MRTAVSRDRGAVYAGPRGIRRRPEHLHGRVTIDVRSLRGPDLTVATTNTHGRQPRVEAELHYRLLVHSLVLICESPRNTT